MRDAIPLAMSVAGLAGQSGFLVNGREPVASHALTQPQPLFPEPGSQSCHD
jgi:hypothetical protein